MDLKKVLIMAMVVGSIGLSHSASVASDAPVILNPKKDKGIKYLTESDLKKSDKPESAKTLTSKIQVSRRYKLRKVVHKIEQPPADINKLIEYNDFEQAEKLLQFKMNKNPKDVQARALWLVALAKQCKLDPAQNELNKYLKTNPKNPDLHYAQGIVYFKRTTSSNMIHIANTPKLLNDALSEFKKAIALSPKDARYYNAAGVIAINQGNTKSAADYFKKAVSIDKTYSTALDNLGTIDYMNGKVSEAEKKYKQALLYNTGNTTAMYHLAQSSVAKHDYATAIMHLNNAIYINPNSAASYNLIGEVYDKQGNEAAAINAFKKSIQVKPEFPFPYLNLAELYEQRGDGEFAIEQLKTALDVCPDFNDAKIKIADLSLANAKYTQAIDNYTVLVGVEGYNDDALKGLANAYFEQAQVSASKALTGSNKDYYKAIDAINKAIIANHNDLELRLAKLKLYKITNQSDLSEKVLTEITLAPVNDLGSLVTKGEAYLTLNNYQEAKKMFDMAATSTKSTDENLYLAEILIYHQQYDNAKIILQNVLDKDAQNKQAQGDLTYIAQCEKNAAIYLKSADYYQKTKNPGVALEYIARALAINPNNPDARLMLAQSYEVQRNYAAALTNYKMYSGLATSESEKNRAESKIKELEKLTKIIQ